MATLLDTISAILAKAGYATDSQESKDVTTALSNLAGVEAPEALSKATDSLMSIEGAIAKDEVRNHLYAEFLAPMDKQLLKQASEIMNPDELAAFKAEKSTYKKATMLSEAQLNALKEAKKTATKAGDTDAVKTLNDQIAELNRKLQEKEQTFEQQLQAERNERENFIFNHEFERHLAGYKLAGVLSEDPDRFGFLRTKIDRALKDAGAIMKRTDKGIELFQADSPTTPYYDKTKNTAVSFKDFSDKIMSAYIATDPAPTPKNAEPKVITGNPSNGQQIRTLAQMQEEIV